MQHPTWYQPTEPTIQTYQKTIQFLEDNIHFQVIRLTGSLFVWIGQTDQLSALSLIMPPYHTLPAQATTILGQTLDDYTGQLGRRLAIKFKMPFYVATDLSDNPELRLFTERQLFTWLKEEVCVE
jgi:hypothetical protein